MPTKRSHRPQRINRSEGESALRHRALIDATAYEGLPGGDLDRINVPRLTLFLSIRRTIPRIG
ncbi:MAG: hypothetical protein DWH91_08770 [Planctomycetota bacterium]|nr:MAG: hypothetical protein DWH91_08770 [Planctomycetota bacterium]